MCGDEVHLPEWIDPRLAKGLTRQLFREGERRISALRRDFLVTRMSNPKARQRNLTRMKKAYEAAGISLGMSAGPEYRSTAFGTFSQFEGADGLKMFVIVRVAGDYDRRGELDQHATQHVAAIDAHAIARLVERNGARSLEDILHSMRPLWGWCRALHASGRDETAILPHGDGIVGIKMTEIYEGELTPRIATMLPGHVLSRYQRQWREMLEPLVGAGPRFPSVSAVGDRHLELAEIAWRCGALWRARSERRAAFADRLASTQTAAPSAAA